MKRILIDVDTQVDFMQPHGSLYVPPVGGAQDEIAEILATSWKGYDAVIGSVDSHAYDAWEFAENGGPFPPHCVKGQPGWLRVFAKYPSKQRFVPMTPHHDSLSKVLVGENTQGGGSRGLNPEDLATEAVDGKVGLYFEKEVYSLFDNPFAEPVLQSLKNKLGGDWSDIQIDVMGYCLGGYCVDAAVEGCLKLTKAKVRVLSYATAAIGGGEGLEKSEKNLTSLGAEWVKSP